MSKKIVFSFFIIWAIFGFLYPLELMARMESANYVIWADVFNSGGSEDSSSANYGLQDSIGEAIILSATSTSATYGIKAGFREMYPDQYITFAVSSNSIDLGALSDSAVSSASHTMTVDTNAPKGFTITVTGSTLTSGANTINAVGAVAAASSVGTEQFGINLMANTTPSVGADPAGTAPIGSSASQYDTADLFALNSGDTVASASNDINSTVFTVSYIANIAAGTDSGTYTTTLVYAATANF